MINYGSKGTEWSSLHLSVSGPMTPSVEVQSPLFLGKLQPAMTGVLNELSNNMYGVWTQQLLDSESLCCKHGAANLQFPKEVHSSFQTS